MKKSLISSHFAHHRPRDKLVTYYQNTMQMFNSFFGEFMRWFALNYRPADTHEEVYV